jgi:hypothetical protein
MKRAFQKSSMFLEVCGLILRGLMRKRGIRIKQAFQEENHISRGLWLCIETTGEIVSDSNSTSIRRGEYIFKVWGLTIEYDGQDSGAEIASQKLRVFQSMRFRSGEIKSE